MISMVTVVANYKQRAFFAKFPEVLDNKLGQNEHYTQDPNHILE
ncbi:hypothetical protein [Kordiimonas sp. SCSIO 12610]|nr:hypothetical protein [Kordiimonas sp. SCSIO 12610]